MQVWILLVKIRQKIIFLNLIFKKENEKSFLEKNHEKLGILLGTKILLPVRLYLKLGVKMVRLNLWARCVP